MSTTISATLESYETSFHQDLNGDGVIGSGRFNLQHLHPPASGEQWNDHGCSSIHRKLYPSELQVCDRRPRRDNCLRSSGNNRHSRQWCAEPAAIHFAESAGDCDAGSQIAWWPVARRSGVAGVHDDGGAARSVYGGRIPRPARPCSDLRDCFAANGARLPDQTAGLCCDD